MLLRVPVASAPRLQGIQVTLGVPDGAPTLVQGDNSRHSRTVAAGLRPPETDTCITLGHPVHCAHPAWSPRRPGRVHSGPRPEAVMLVGGLALVVTPVVVGHRGRVDLGRTSDV